MDPSANHGIHQRIEDLYNRESRRVFASLVRLLRDFDLAEEALHESFAAALSSWPTSGIPANPCAWLISTGRFKAIDALRRRGKLTESLLAVMQQQQTITETNQQKSSYEIEDDRLRLIFTCCHPAIDPLVQIPLTLREVCGLTTDEIAGAFLVTPTTMAQRLVRGKSKIRDAGIPFVIPTAEELPERLNSVLKVVYLVFNEGYSASGGDAVTRADLSGEAIRLGRLIVHLMAEPEAMGLLALMLLQESRRAARTTNTGDLVLLEDQDRARWDQSLIAEGLRCVDTALLANPVGPYSLQAAIAAVHASAPTPAATDWRQIVALYETLYARHSSPVVELNLAVAVAMADGPEAGLSRIDAILARGDLEHYHLTHAARADLLRRLDRKAEALSAYEMALRFVKQEPEKRFLLKRLDELGG